MLSLSTIVVDVVDVFQLHGCYFLAFCVKNSAVLKRFVFLMIIHTKKRRRTTRANAFSLLGLSKILLIVHLCRGCVTVISPPSVC